MTKSEKDYLDAITYYSEPGVPKQMQLDMARSLSFLHSSRGRQPSATITMLVRKGFLGTVSTLYTSPTANETFYLLRSNGYATFEDCICRDPELFHPDLVARAKERLSTI